MVLFHWIIQDLLTFFIVSIFLNLNYQIPLIQLDLLHNLKETFLIRDTFNVHVLNFPFLCSNIPAAAADGVYVSQLKWCAASWASPIWIVFSFIESVSQINTDMFGLYWLQVILFVFAHDHGYVSPVVSLPGPFLIYDLSTGV
jgi:hypothetical protein